MKAAIERSRQLQIERQKKEKASKKQEDKDFAEFWRLRNEELQLAEEQEREEERQRAKELAAYQQDQLKKRNE